MAMARTNTRHLRAAAGRMNPAPAQVGHGAKSTRSAQSPKPDAAGCRAPRSFAPARIAAACPGPRFASAVAPRWRSCGTLTPLRRRGGARVVAGAGPAVRGTKEAAWSDPELRLGVDLGGTKIEIVALDRDGTRTPAPPHVHAAGRLRRDARGGRRRWSPRRSASSAPAAASASARRARSRARPASCADSNSVCLNGRPIRRDLAAALGREMRDRQRRQLLRAVRGDRRGGGRAPVVFGVILGTGVGAGIVVARRGARRAQRHRRRVGPQPAAVAARRRAAGPGLLLRPRRLHRDLALRPRAWSATTGDRPATRSRHRPSSRRAAGGDAGVRARRSRATRTASPGRSRT